MADTDNKEVAVQTVSEPKPPQMPDAPVPAPAAPEPPAVAADPEQAPQMTDVAQPSDVADGPQPSEAADAEKPDKELAVRIKKLERQVRRTVTKARQVTQRGGARAKATAGPALSKTAAGLRKGSERGGLVAGTVYRERVKPFFSRLADRMASRLNRTSLARDYRRLLLLAHRYGPDRTVEQLCFVPTAKHIPLSIVRVPHQLRRSGHDYRPSPRLVFEWGMELLPEPVERREFVDYGAGRGRVLLMASHYPFERIMGSEIAEELANDSRLNIAQYPRSLMKCRDVECKHISALRLPIPEGETVFYFNNPFDRSMLERVIAQIVRSYKQEPRPLYVICVDIDADEMFADTGVFVRIPASMRQRLKIRAFSPYAIAVYRTIYQAPADDDDDNTADVDNGSDPDRPDQDA